MSRELNPQLFQNPSPVVQNTNQNNVTTPAKEDAWLDRTDMQIFSAQIQAVKGKFKDVANHFGILNGKVERLAQTIIRQDETMKKTVQEVRSQFADLARRVTGSQLKEEQIQELIDRQNHVLQSFEVRLQKMQKILSEREFQLLAAQGALEEARREIEKLKKL